MFNTIFTSNGYSVEYGAILYTNTSFRFDGNDYEKSILEQNETFAPHLKVYFGENSHISVEALIRHKLIDVFGIDYDADNKLVLDLPLLKFEKLFNFQNAQTLKLAIGRMFMVDATGVILSQTNDGILFKYASQKVQVGLYGGYSGLQNIKNTEILCADGIKYAVDDEKKVYDFAAPYGVCAASIAMPYLFAEQTLSFEGIACLKTSGLNELPDNDKNRFYATTMLSGQIIPPLFHSFSLTAETNDFSQAALFAKFILTYFAPFKDAKFSFSAVYASGENGMLSTFVGITRQIACLSAQEPNYSGIVKFGVDGTIIPFGKFRILFGTDVVFNIETEAEFYGFQAQLGMDWNLFSDLNISFGANTFIGKDEAVNRTEIKLAAALAF